LENAVPHGQAFGCFQQTFRRFLGKLIARYPELDDFLPVEINCSAGNQSASTFGDQETPIEYTLG
jgi:hypothetical protein